MTSKAIELKSNHLKSQRNTRRRAALFDRPSDTRQAPLFSTAVNSVHIGIGSGNTAKLFAKLFSQHLKTLASNELTKLVFHALTPGMSELDPLTAPIASFSLFDDFHADFIGMFGRPITKRLHEAAESPGYKESFDRKEAIDIVVVSPADQADIHGLLRQLLQDYEATDLLRKLESQGWCGDLLYNPYSKKEAIEIEGNTGPLTLLSLHDLARFVQNGKKVVLAVPPCCKCNKLRDNALKPLLKEKHLNVWTDLITDVHTARSVLL